MCAQATSVWLHDDTEEDLVGTDWRQQAISSLYTGLCDVAWQARLPWHVGNQLTLVAWKPDGTAWRPSPDIMVHLQGGSAPRKEMVARTDGLPALLIEVASESTWRYDVDTVAGKAAGYLALGVPEYLVFDPTGECLGEPCRGWRYTAGTVREWRPTAAGRYESQELGIAFQPDGVFLRVFDAAGHPMPYEYEKTQELEARAREIERLRAELDRLRGQVIPPSSTGDDETPGP